ncbi:hypothetical protein SASPL_152184 [Salvia splendens]|uniref:t-SNARE coiled-coil homology domain-containing protein n=1 Tax=Salvia splendens TaxID=180675 RepID=A0A8X8Z121_SALSN|nr:hypothetical protein SASPL_152184 [Salvia splendens]
MNDLLTDSFVGDAKGNTSRESDIEMGPRLPRSNSDVALESFHKQIQEIEKHVDKLSGLLQNLKEANEESKSVTKASSMKAIRKRMEKDVDEVGKIARGIKVKIETMNKDNLTNRQKPGCGKGTAVDRSRTNMTSALMKKFRDLMTEFQTLRQRIEEEYREVVERRVVTVTGSRPDEEIYLDMAVLVEAQGDILDNIESQVNLFSQTCNDALVQVTNAVDHVQSLRFRTRENCMCIAISSAFLKRLGLVLDRNCFVGVKNAVDHVTMGTDALQTAKDLQKKSRKCMMIAIILMLAIAIIIVLSILKPWKK